MDALNPEISEFVTDLKIFATGSYLRPEERELWEAPFAESAVAEVRQILDQFAQTLDSSDSESAAEAATLSCVDALTALNSAHFDAIFDEDEYAELAAILNRGLTLKNAETRVGIDTFEQDAFEPDATATTS